MLKSGALVASASSKQVELDMKGLRREASRRQVLGAKNPLVRLPTVRYRLGNRSITVLGDGWPVNFDGDVEDIAPAEIQITRALMFAGALQAAGIRRGGQTGVIPLDNKNDSWLVAQHKALLREARRATMAPQQAQQAAAGQAAGGGAGRGVSSRRRPTRETFPIGDPDRWTEAVVELGRRF
jgi:hypothetical protein